MILTAISFVIFSMQVLLLPTQLFSYLENKIDKTRLRFLLLALTFVIFNSVWVILKLISSCDSDLCSLILTYSGLLLLIQFYYYITKELSLVTGIFSVLNFAILLIFTELFRESLLIVVAKEFLPYTKVFFFLVYQAIALTFGIRVVRLIFLKESGTRSPIENASIGAIIIAMLLPMVLFRVKIESLYNVMLNCVFLVIAIAYFRHYITRLKLEKKMFPRQGNVGENLQEQYIRIPEIFFKYDLSSREREISIYLLKGMTYEEIAEKISRSAGSIRNQASKAFRKADVNSLREFRDKFQYESGEITPKRLDKT